MRTVVTLSVIALAASEMGSGNAIAQTGGQGQAQAEPCAIGRLNFPEASFPPDVRVRTVRNQPTIELPFRRLSVLINKGGEPFYLIAETGDPNGEDRLNSELPRQYYPFFKFHNGLVFEWRLPNADEIPSGPNQGQIQGGYTWRSVMSPSYRQLEEGAGIALVPGAFAYLSLTGKPFDTGNCDYLSGPTTRSVALTGFWGGAPLTIEGTIRYQPY